MVPLDGSTSSVTMELSLCVTLDIGLSSIFFFLLCFGGTEREYRGGPSYDVTWVAF